MSDYSHLSQKHPRATLLNIPFAASQTLLVTKFPTPNVAQSNGDSYHDRALPVPLTRVCHERFLATPHRQYAHRILLHLSY